MDGGNAKLARRMEGETCWIDLNNSLQFFRRQPCGMVEIIADKLISNPTDKITRREKKDDVFCPKGPEFLHKSST